MLLLLLSVVLLRTYDHLIENKFDIVFPIIAYSFPIQRALRVDQGKVSMIQKKNLNVRSQDLEELFHDAGQFYWGSLHKLMINKKLYNNNTGGFVISELNAQDIDNETDWKLAELKYRFKT